MSRFAFRSSLALALAATASMVASPVFAAQLSLPAAPAAPVAHSANGDNGAVLNHSRGRYPGYGRYHRHNRGGISGGDVLAGVLVLGGIAAIASAASNAKRDRDTYRDRDYPYRDDDYRYRDNRQDERYRDGYDQGYRDGRDAGDGYYDGASSRDSQWNDDDYARAREAQGGY